MKHILICFIVSCLTLLIISCNNFVGPSSLSPWTRVNSGLSEGTFAVSGSNVFAANHQGVFLSDNGGTSWISVNNGLTDTFATCLTVSGSGLFAGTWGAYFVQRTAEPLGAQLTPDCRFRQLSLLLRQAGRIFLPEPPMTFFSPPTMAHFGFQQITVYRATMCSDFSFLIQMFLLVLPQAASFFPPTTEQAGVKQILVLQILMSMHSPSMARTYMREPKVVCSVPATREELGTRSMLVWRIRSSMH